MPTLMEIAQAIGGRVEGDGSVEITHACEIAAGSPGGLSFLADPKYARHLASTAASAVIVDTQVDPGGKPAIRVANPAKGFALALSLLYPPQPAPEGIDPAARLGTETVLGKGVSIGPFAVIEDGVTIGAETAIFSGAFIGRGTRIGKRCTIHPRVVVYAGMEIGDSVIIHAGAVIGADGFGYTTEDDLHYKIPQVGGVVLEAGVEVGANTTIDRGTLSNTVIGEMTKLDNLVHIAHNVNVGRGCLFAAQVGVAGSTTIGDYVTLAGQVGVADHLTIGDRAVVAAKSAVLQAVPAGRFYAGIPAGERQQWLRQSGAVKALPEMSRRLRRLEARMGRIKADEPVE